MDNKEIALTVVSKVTGVAKSTILSRTRQWPAVEARQLVILLLNRDGATDEAISWMLNRGRCAILESRHNASDALHAYRRHFQWQIRSRRHFTGSMRHTIETNNAEIKLLQQINSAISDEKEAKGRRKKAEEALDKLRTERLNPQPRLF